MTSRSVLPVWLGPAGSVGEGPLAARLPHSGEHKIEVAVGVCP